MTAPSDLDVALAAAHAGSVVLGDMFGTDLAREHKTATDFATVADRAAEQAILDVVRAARPDDGFEGEELGVLDAAPHGRTWLVDPLCGTVNFAAGSPAFCVNVALVDHPPLTGGTPVDVTTTAVVVHPPTGETYWTDVGRFGTIGIDTPPPPNRLVNINADGPLDRPFVGAQLAADPAFRATFNPRVESTTLALAWVAAGRRLAYVTDGRCERSVHFAAGIALCQAAGTVITDFDGAPVHTGPGVVAARDAETHATLLRLVARHR
ncbi:MAG TPA: inositol monophosphatase family protein [Nocardioides sp.]|nr:inositol monophosphatase family protein [Nocardioides sp.]